MKGKISVVTMEFTGADLVDIPRFQKWCDEVLLPSLRKG